jgi:hypothetical protein
LVSAPLSLGKKQRIHIKYLGEKSASLFIM